MQGGEVLLVLILAVHDGTTPAVCERSERQHCKAQIRMSLVTDLEASSLTMSKQDKYEAFKPLRRMARVIK